MYLALYRKWRPKIFDDVVGQQHITTTLKNEIKWNKTAHSYLFTGSRGTGKTSCSKILAMAVNCLNPQDGNPCLQCANCRGIEDGTILDVLEIDAASNNGVDDVRLLREEANYTPTQCKYRVYIIDETHMLSVSAFNALLKIMEEPPPHVKFILATTEVHKVPATVLSRCQRFDFTRIQTDAIAERLLEISEQEEFTLTENAAYLIARLADGGMRDAYSILDQCIAYSNQVDTDVIVQATGLVLKDHLFEMVECIQKQNPTEAITMVDRLYSQSKDLQKLMGELIEHFRNLMIVKTVEHCTDLVRCLPEELKRLKEQSKTVPMNLILRSISILQECLDKISKDYDKRLTVEMALIKLCSPRLDASVEALAQRIEILENQLKFRSQSVSVLSDPAAVNPFNTAANQSDMQTFSVDSSIEKSTENIAEKPLKETAEQKFDSVPRPKPQIEQNASGLAASKPSKKSAVLESSSQKLKSSPEPLDVWVEVLATLRGSDPALAGILAGSMAYTAEDSLFIDSPNSLFASMIKRADFIKTLIQVLEHKTGIRYKIRIKKNKAEPQKNLTVLDEITQNAQLMGIEIHEQ